MRKLTYQNYYDKVFGCWLGKCFSGNIGAPYEGMKQPLQFEYSPKFMEKILANDDLDLQVLWLDVLENKGLDFTSDDLAEGFLRTCEYGPGEYAVFKKNFRMGIHPPLSGEYCNTLYRNGMGCPIRSEIWACIAPGNPELAAEFSARDGVLDHKGDSVYAEQFLAALEAEAFFEKDLERLIAAGMKYLPADSRIRRLVEDTLRWCAQDGDPMRTRSRILRDYGHQDCTNLYQNIGFTLLALFYSELDFMEATMIALNCGFDTDCTCATVGAIIGLIRGGSSIVKEFGFEDLEYKLGLRMARRDYSVKSLAEDTCKMGVYTASVRNREVEITGYAGDLYQFEESLPAVTMAVEYEENLPCIGFGGQRKFTLILCNHTGREQNAELTLSLPEALSIEYPDRVTLAAGETRLELTARTEDAPALPDSLKVTAQVSLEEGTFLYEFGFAAAVSWTMYGPFWENITTVPQLKPGESYWSYMKGDTQNENMDFIRNYHINTFTDPEREYLRMEDLFEGTPPAHTDVAFEGKQVETYFEKLRFEDFTGFQGPCTIYLKRQFLSPRAFEAAIQIGHSDGMECWMNGERLAKKRGPENWTAENTHLCSIQIQEGLNTIVLKLSRQSTASEFSMALAEITPCGDFLLGFELVNAKAETAAKCPVR